MKDLKATILEAARKRFAHYGLPKTTMNDIASDIGMSKASLYYYFPDKENLFLAVMEDDFNQFIDAISALVDKPSKATYKLRKFVRMRQDLLSRLVNLAKVEDYVIPEALRPVYGDLRQRFFDKEVQQVARILEMGASGGEFRKVAHETYANLFLSALVGLRVQSVANSYLSGTQASDDHNQQALLLAEVFLSALKSKS